MSFPIPAHETRRIAALRRYDLLDKPKERVFDDFAELASQICGTPVGLVTLIDEERQSFKAQFGSNLLPMPRSQAFCAHTIMSDRVMVVEDATADERFAKNPLVVAAPNIRFYAGAPLVTSEGDGLGALCVTDSVPRHLTAGQKRSLEMLARQVVVQFEFRRISEELANTLSEVKTLSGMLPICGHCKNIRNDEGYWKSVEEFLSSKSEAHFSHGVCPPCADTLLQDFMKMLPEKDGMGLRG